VGGSYVEFLFILSWGAFKESEMRMDRRMTGDLVPTPGETARRAEHVSRAAATGTARISDRRPPLSLRPKDSIAYWSRISLDLQVPPSNFDASLSSIA